MDQHADLRLGCGAEPGLDRVQHPEELPLVDPLDARILAVRQGREHDRSA